MVVDHADRYQPIEDYGIIGDLHTVALVGMDGSIDFLSFPQFDSPTIFARLLDAERGGSFSIHPQLEDGARKQLYLPDTTFNMCSFWFAEAVARSGDVQRGRFFFEKMLGLTRPTNPAGSTVRRAAHARRSWPSAATPTS